MSQRFKPAAETDFARMFSETQMKLAEIAAVMLTIHGIAMTPEAIGLRANRRGLYRGALNFKNPPPATRLERMATASLDRERGGTTDNRRIHGPRYPGPIGGYRTQATTGARNV